MKTILQPLLSSLVFGALALGLQAQPAPKILVVDMAALYDKHYKTEEQLAKLQTDEQKAQEDLEKLNSEGNKLVEEYRELADQARNNPALSNDAKAKLEQEAQQKLEAIQAKQTEVQNFRVNVQRSLQSRLNNFRGLMLEEISKIAADIAKQKGATLLVDKSGPSLIGISNFVYVDPSYDITNEVMAAVNRDRPATSTAPAPAAAKAPAPAATTPAPAANAPAVSFPGTGK